MTRSIAGVREPYGQCFWCTRPAITMIYRPVGYRLPACREHEPLDASVSNNTGSAKEENTV